MKEVVEEEVRGRRGEELEDDVAAPAAVAGVFANHRLLRDALDGTSIPAALGVCGGCCCMLPLIDCCKAEDEAVAFAALSASSNSDSRLAEVALKSS